MNTRDINRPQIKSTNGFTIIEVVLVLAIAGLIFLMVFIALPALQKGQRDAQRKDDLSRINTQINNYSSSNRGKIPTTGGINTFVQKYLGGTSGATTGSEYMDPSTSSGYTFITTGEPTQGQIAYQTNALCGPDGTAGTSSTTTLDGVTPTARSYVLRVSLENQKAPYCIDNR